MKKICTIIVVFLLLLLPFPSSAHAQEISKEWDKACVGSTYGNSLTAPVPGKPTSANDVATIAGAECLVANVLATAITLIGITAFVMFLVGGFRYLTAGSNTKGVEAGKNSISFAILGIVIALASVLIVRTISVLTGVQTIMTFSIVK